MAALHLLRHNIYVVTGQHNSLSAWHIVVVDSLKTTLFTKAIHSGNLDVANYGTVLESGWGGYPPQTVIDAICTQYS